MPCRQVAEYNGRPGGQQLVSIGPGGPVYAPFKTEADCNGACREGACCEAGGCSVKPQCACQGPGQSFRGVGSVCNQTDCVPCSSRIKEVRLIRTEFLGTGGWTDGYDSGRAPYYRSKETIRARANEDAYRFFNNGNPGTYPVGRTVSYMGYDPPGFDALTLVPTYADAERCSCTYSGTFAGRLEERISVTLDVCVDGGTVVRLSRISAPAFYSTYCLAQDVATINFPDTFPGIPAPGPSFAQIVRDRPGSVTLGFDCFLRAQSFAPTDQCPDDEGVLRIHEDRLRPADADRVPGTTALLYSERDTDVRRGFQPLSTLIFDGGDVAVSGVPYTVYKIVEGTPNGKCLEEVTVETPWYRFRLEVDTL